MKDEFIPRVGVWGQRHYNYLKKSNPTVINVMRMKGTLEQYLTDLNRDAQDMFDLLMKQYAEIEGVTEHLKVTNQMEWVRRINNIRCRVTEFVCKELVYTSPKRSFDSAFSISNYFVENKEHYFQNA